MTLSSRRTLAAAAALLALAGGAGAAYATTQGGSKAGASRTETPLLTGVAGRLNVSAVDLLDAFKAEATARVDLAAATGRIPAAVADRVKQRIAAATLEKPFGLLGAGHRRNHGGRLRRIAKAAAAYIGITVGELRTELRAGKSPAQSAKDHGKTVPGLKAAIYDAIKARLDKAVAAGRLSQVREQQALDRLKSRLDDIVNRVGPPARP